MSQKRLNYATLLHTCTCKDKTDILDLLETARQFVSVNDDTGLTLETLSNKLLFTIDSVGGFFEVC